MHTLPLVLLRPLKASEQIKANPRWLVAFLILAALSTASDAVIHPYLVQATLVHLPPGATNADKQVVVETLNRELPARLAFHPIRLFAGWAVFALTLLYICKAFVPREVVGFRQIFSLEVHAEVASVAGTIAAMIVSASHPGPGMADIPLSVAGFITVDLNFIIKSLLTSLNLFTLWQLVILSTGVSVLCGFGRMKSILIVFLVWTLSMMFNIGAMKLVQQELHLLL